MKTLLFVLAAVAIATTALVTTAPKPAEAACVVGIKSPDVLWMRSGPGSRYRKIGAIPSHACDISIYWNTCRGFWCRVRYRGINGWTHTRYLR